MHRTRCGCGATQVLDAKTVSSKPPSSCTEAIPVLKTRWQRRPRSWGAGLSDVAGMPPWDSGRVYCSLDMFLNTAPDRLTSGSASTSEYKETITSQSRSGSSLCNFGCVNTSAACGYF